MLRARVLLLLPCNPQTTHLQGLGFWYGGKMVVDSTRSAMVARPIPAGFNGPFTFDGSGALVEGSLNSAFFYSNMVAKASCVYRPIGSFGKGDFVPYTGAAFDVCACGLPWTLMKSTLDTSDVEWAVQARAGGLTGSMLFDPSCGCTVRVFFAL